MVTIVSPRRSSARPLRVTADVEQPRSAASSTLRDVRVLALLVLLFAAAEPAAQLPQISLAPREGVLRFAVAGDTGEGTERVAKGIARVHAQQPLEAIVLTGDNFYPCGVKSPEEERWSLIRPLTKIGPPILPVLGNHDFCGGADPEAQVRATGIVPNWIFPARQYVARGSVADFVFIDTSPFIWGGPSPADEIRDAFASSDAVWRVVVGHHPILSSGYHGYFPRDEVAKMRTLTPFLRDAGVNLYICGHDHHMELVRGTSMLHLVSGAGSDPIPPIKLRARTIFPPEIRFERIGFAVVEITKREIRVRMYDGEGRARSEWITHVLPARRSAFLP